MGEITEMVMEGILCECCGVFLGPEPEHNFDKSAENFEGFGLPTKCEDCI